MAQPLPGLLLFILTATWGTRPGCQCAGQTGLEGHRGSPKTLGSVGSLLSFPPSPIRMEDILVARPWRMGGWVTESQDSMVPRRSHCAHSMLSSVEGCGRCLSHLSLPCPTFPHWAKKVLLSSLHADTVVHWDEVFPYQ